MSQTPVSKLATYYFETDFNIIFPSTSSFFPSVRYSYQHCVHTPRVSLGIIITIIIINSIDLLKCFKPQNIYLQITLRRKSENKRNGKTTKTLEHTGHK